jgi:hypothetical protein
MTIARVGTLVVNTGFTPHFRAAVSSVEPVESDPDAVPIRDELFAGPPKIEAGPVRTPTAPVGGTDLKAVAARRHVSTG